jgi:hypothetical protein
VIGIDDTEEHQRIEDSKKSNFQHRHSLKSPSHKPNFNDDDDDDMVDVTENDDDDTPKLGITEYFTLAKTGNLVRSSSSSSFKHHY